MIEKIAGSIQSQVTGMPGGGNALQNSIGTILRSVFIMLGIVSVIVIILGGVSYSTSMGDPGKATKAKSTIIYGVVGLVIALLAFSIVLFIFDKLK